MGTNLNYRRYFVALIISLVIFMSGFLASNTLTNKKLESLKNIEDDISLSILSSETEYDILKEVSCENFSNQTTLNKEIGELADNLSILESNNENDERILDAKKRYSLLLIKDYLFSKRLFENCGTKPAFVIYFYGNADVCPECIKTGIALSSLREDYEKLRVYAFDYNLNLPLIKTFGSLYNIKEEELPAVVINNKKYVGLNNKVEIEKLLPKEIKESFSTTTKNKQSFKFIFKKETSI
jgi:hypothetical protein